MLTQDPVRHAVRHQLNRGLAAAFLTETVYGVVFPEDELTEVDVLADDHRVEWCAKGGALEVELRLLESALGGLDGLPVFVGKFIGGGRRSVGSGS